MKPKMLIFTLIIILFILGIKDNTNTIPPSNPKYKTGDTLYPDYVHQDTPLTTYI